MVHQQIIQTSSKHGFSQHGIQFLMLGEFKMWTNLSNSNDQSMRGLAPSQFLYKIPRNYRTKVVVELERLALNYGTEEPQH